MLSEVDIADLANEKQKPSTIPNLSSRTRKVSNYLIIRGKCGAPVDSELIRKANLVICYLEACEDKQFDEKMQLCFFWCAKRYIASLEDDIDELQRKEPMRDLLLRTAKADMIQAKTLN